MTPDAAEDPFDDPSYQRWLSEISRTCRARDKPCGACQAGGICDGALGGDRYEDEEMDLDYGREDDD